MNCRRTFAEGDYVFTTERKREGVSKHAAQFGYAHVACEPPTPRLSRKAIKASEKPLLEAFVNDAA